jgi:prepilin-type processing-associated H-X9-DG protein/prepilin-type N-terminal cleavage/methylation domain-containing protein
VELMLTTGSSRRSGAFQLSGRKSAFTLTELAVVVGIIAILVGLFSSALNTTKNKALKLSCLDNLKQLQFAWTMYVDDNDDKLPLNQTAASGMNPKIPFKRNSTNSWVGGNPLQDMTTENIERGTLYPYTQNSGIYRCPMDGGTVINHPEVERTRSYSMNAYLGGDRVDTDPRVKLRFSELVSPKPDGVFVFIEEHNSSRWGSSFDVAPREKIGTGISSWISLPSDRHNQGCNLSFADGHVEYWRWFTAKKTKVQAAHLAAAGSEISDLRKLQGAIPFR